MTDAYLQHFLGGTVVDGQGLVQTGHGDVSHHAVAAQIEEVIVFLADCFGVDGCGKRIRGTGIIGG